jgi:hypothetical protein
MDELTAFPRRYGPLAAHLLTPVALTSYVLAFWRFGADMNWLGEFFVSKGLLSRWQVWLLLGAITQATAHQLNRLSRRNDTVSY